MSDYPTCETCDYWSEEKQGKGVCTNLGISKWRRGADLYWDPKGKLTALRTTADFGCILHSDLEDDAKEYDAEDVSTRSPSQQDTYTV